MRRTVASLSSVVASGVKGDVGRPEGPPVEVLAVCPASMLTVVFPQIRRQSCTRGEEGSRTRAFVHLSFGFSAGNVLDCRARSETQVTMFLVDSPVDWHGTCHGGRHEDEFQEWR